MALRLVAFEAVHHARLGYAEREPVLHVLLKGDIELRAELLRLFRYGLFAIEFDLESELSYQRLMLAAGAPQPDIALGKDASTEVQLTKRKQHLLNYAFVHKA